MGGLAEAGADPEAVEAAAFAGGAWLERGLARADFGGREPDLPTGASLPIWRCGVEAKPRSREAGCRRHRA